MWLERFAVYGVPVLAGALCVAVLLGPGRARAVTGVRVYGLIADGAERTALRISTLRHEDERFRAVALEGLSLELRQGGQLVSRWQGRSDASGHAVALLRWDAPLEGSVEVRVSHEGGPLGAGQARLAPPLPVRSLSPVAVEGEIPTTVWLPRGQAVPEIPEPFVVWARSDEEEAPSLAVEVSGGTVQRPDPPRSECDEAFCEHRWTLLVTPDAMSTQLALSLRRGEATTRWEGAVPLSPGTIWIAPEPTEEGEYRLRSPVPRDEAFVTLVSRQGRIWSGRAPLKVDARGFASGAIRLPELPAGAVTVRVASEPGEPEGTTVGWPLRPREGVVEGGREVRIVDALPARIEAEQQRRRAARRPAYGLILAAALFELVFLAHRGRRASRRLRRHLDRQLPPASAALLEQRSPLWWLTVLSFGLVLAFVVLAALAAFAG